MWSRHCALHGSIRYKSQREVQANSSWLEWLLHVVWGLRPWACGAAVRRGQWPCPAPWAFVVLECCYGDHLIDFAVFLLYSLWVDAFSESYLHVLTSSFLQLRSWFYRFFVNILFFWDLKIAKHIFHSFPSPEVYILAPVFLLGVCFAPLDCFDVCPSPPQLQFHCS